MALLTAVPHVASQGALGVMQVVGGGGDNATSAPGGADLSSVQAIQAADQDPVAWLRASLAQCLVVGGGEGGATSFPATALAADASFVACMTQMLVALRVFSFA
jgi:hypothetical protein